jgi:hypothetical protein
MLSSPIKYKSKLKFNQILTDNITKYWTVFRSSIPPNLNHTDPVWQPDLETGFLFLKQKMCLNHFQSVWHVIFKTKTNTNTFLGNKLDLFLNLFSVTVENNAQKGENLL